MPEHNIKLGAAEGPDVIVIGGGFSGISAAYFLKKSGLETLILEAGRVGLGVDRSIGTKRLALCGGTNEPVPFGKINSSFIDSPYATEKSEGALQMRLEGVHRLNELAESLDRTLVRKNGGCVVSDNAHLERFALYEYFVRSGNYEVIGASRISEMFGIRGFSRGIYSREDSVLDVQKYLRALVNAQGIDVVDNTYVTSIEERSDRVHVNTLERGEMVARNVVLATNGFWPDKQLQKILGTYWTFIIGYEVDRPNSPSGTEALFEFAAPFRYWTVQDGLLIVGGGDIPTSGSYAHPGEENREKTIASLDTWSKAHFDFISGKKPTVEHFGVFALTEDAMPLCGRFTENSRVFYLVGCGGSGMPTLTMGARLLPHLIKGNSLTAAEKKYAHIVDPRRFII